VSGKIKDISGQRFGKLTALECVGTERRGSKGKGKGLRLSPLWNCICDCGRSREVSTRYLSLYKVSSCVECAKGILETFRNASDRLYDEYEKSARNRNKEWDLTRDDFYRLVTSPCYYTGVPPKKLVLTQEGDFYWNGVDRVDNSKGYVPGNVVPCCDFANMAKGTHSVEEFTDWLKQVTRFWKDKI
jgi:hypothetical protein